MNKQEREALEWAAADRIMKDAYDHAMRAKPGQVWPMLWYVMDIMTTPGMDDDAIMRASASISPLTARIRNERIAPPEEKPDANPTHYSRQ